MKPYKPQQKRASLQTIHTNSTQTKKQMKAKYIIVRSSPKFQKESEREAETNRCPGTRSTRQCPTRTWRSYPVPRRRWPHGSTRTGYGSWTRRPKDPNPSRSGSGSTPRRSQASSTTTKKAAPEARISHTTSLGTSRRNSNPSGFPSKTQNELCLSRSLLS